MTFHIFFMYPETRGKSLEEMDIIFDNNIPAWKTGNIKSFEDRVPEIRANSTVSGPADVKKGPATASDSNSDIEQKETV